MSYQNPTPGEKQFVGSVFLAVGLWAFYHLAKKIIIMVRQDEVLGGGYIHPWPVWCAVGVTLVAGAAALGIGIRIIAKSDG